MKQPEESKQPEGAGAPPGLIVFSILRGSECSQCKRELHSGSFLTDCPPSEAVAIALHTAERGSGRVGRSASGRALDEGALRLAVIASIRHKHTHYDTLLMQGLDRSEARWAVRDKIEEVLSSWENPQDSTC
jgi:hypothetical protein